MQLLRLITMWAAALLFGWLVVAFTQVREAGAVPWVSDLRQAFRPLRPMVLMLTMWWAARMTFRVYAAPVLVTAGVLYQDSRGNIQMAMGSIIFGVLLLVVGLILSDLIIDQVGKAAASLGQETYSDVEHDSAQSINGLLVILYYIVLIVLGVGMIGGGAWGAYRQVRGGGM